MTSVEGRLMDPFYLRMMGLNARENAGGLWSRLVEAGRTASLDDVRQLLAPDHWRPVVMGAWFCLKFDPDQIGQELLEAIGRSRGSLTAPPLAASASVLLGERAIPTLAEYIRRDHECGLGSASFVAAVVEDLGGETNVTVENHDREEPADMLNLARRLRSALQESETPAPTTRHRAEPPVRQDVTSSAWRFGTTES